MLPAGDGGILIAGASVSGILVPGVLSLGEFGEAAIPAVAKLGFVVLPWRACIRRFHARWESDQVLYTLKDLGWGVSQYLTRFRLLVALIRLIPLVAANGFW